MLGSTGANNFIKHCLNRGELVDLYLEHLPVGHDVNRGEIKVWTADRDRLEYGVCCVQLRGILCLSRLFRTIVCINSGDFYSIEAKKRKKMPVTRVISPSSASIFLQSRRGGQPGTTMELGSFLSWLKLPTHSKFSRKSSTDSTTTWLDYSLQTHVIYCPF